MDLTWWIQIHLQLKLTVNILECYITRLPECGKYKANFTIIENNTYFGGNLLKRIFGISRTDCVLSCVSTLQNCMLVNHNIFNNTCELQNVPGRYFSPTNRIVDSQAGWSFLTTDYAVALRGRKCVGLNPCGENELCYDDCTDQGYSCKPLQAIEKRNVVTMSGSSQMTSPGNAVDGSLVKMFRANTEENSFIKIDLNDEEEIEFMRAMLSGNQVIRIGSNENFLENQKCTTVITGDVFEKHVCDNSIMKGRYIYIHKTNPGIAARVIIAEIEIYTL